MPWVDATLAKAQRTDALSALVEDLRRPNADYVSTGRRPLLQRNPLAFWRGLAIALFLLNITLLYRLSR